MAQQDKEQFVHSFNPNRYDDMLYRRAGHSGLQLPAISLGAWETFGGYRGEDIARDCFFRAFDLGITHFDLANNYGKPPGNAETVVGRIIRQMPRDELLISTKAGFWMWPGPYGEWGSKKYLVASLDQSLKRLGLDYVDIFYHHRPDPATPLEETIGALALIIQQGKALYAGVSNYSGAEFAQAARIAEKMGLSLTLHQPRYNMLDRFPETNVLEHTKRNGTGVIVYSPLAQGLLTDKYLGEQIPADSRAAAWWGKNNVKDVTSEEKFKRLQELNTLAKQRGQTLAQMAIAWILRLPTITSVLIGASKVQQVEENVAALQKLEFSEEELAQIDRLTL